MRTGAEVAVSAALGPAADALLVASTQDVRTAFAWLRDADAGRATLVTASAAAGTALDPGADALPPGCERLVDLVEIVDERFRVPVNSLLDATVLVADLSAAGAVLERRPDLRVVTRQGDLLGPAMAVGGSAHPPSAIELTAAAEEAQAGVDESSRRAELAHEALEPARAEVARTRAEIDAASAALHGADARSRAFREQMAKLERARGTAGAEVIRLEQARTRAESARDRAYGALHELEAALATASAQPEVDERSSVERDRLVAATSAVRAAEVEARLSVRTSEERARALQGRADGLVRAAAGERAARAAA
ncbi:chromosome segregation protein SMC, partial [Frankia sp. R82]|nr:chromosome segregation protein SMC [Frankia sp. R82]